MIVVTVQRWALALGMLLLTAAALGQTAAAQSPVNAKMRQRDGRLNTPVSFSADRIYLGELLEKLSAKTGVALSIDDTDSFSGVPITCNLDRTPLADVMNSLWSLLGSKNGLWEWTLNSKQSALSYEFRPTEAARSLPKQSNQEMQAAFEAQAQMGMRLAAMSPEERPAHAGPFAPVIMLDVPELDFPGRGLPSEADETWLAMRLFDNILSPSQRTRVLRGETIDIPIRSLSEQNRQDVHALERKRFVIRVDGPREMPECIADTITFEGSRTESALKIIRLLMSISITYRKNGGGRGCLMMTVRGHGKRFYEDWILPGDQRERDAEVHPIHAPTPFPTDSVWQTAPLLTQYVAQAAGTMDASFIAVLPEPFDGEYPSVFDKTPAQFFDEAHNALPSILHKWRDGILLVNYATWCYGDDAQYAYRTVKRLRASVQRQGGQLTLNDVTEPVSTMTNTQLTRLGAEFPPFKAGLGMTPLCPFYQRFPEAMNAHGIPADQNMLEFLRKHRLPGQSNAADGQVRAIRILDETWIDTGGAGHTYRLQVTFNLQDWTDVNVFKIRPIPSQ